MTVTLADDTTVAVNATFQEGLVRAAQSQLKVDILGFKYDIGGYRASFPTTGDQSVTDDDTSYVYLDSSGTLQINTTGFPTTFHFPLARVTTASGEVIAIHNERVLMSASSADIGLCEISYPVDGDVRGGDTATSSNNDVGAVKYQKDAIEADAPRNRWNRTPPKNYISGDVILRLRCSVASSIAASKGTKWQWYWSFRDGTEALGTWDSSDTQVFDVSSQAADTLFDLDLTMPAATMLAGVGDSELFMKLVRWSHDADDDCDADIYVHNVKLRYIGRRSAGQPGQ